jgi:voltage-gated potassium channel
MIKNLIVDGAYFLNTSNSYQGFKQFFYNLLENDNYKYKKYFDSFMIILILISVVILVREVKSHVDDAYLFFNNYIISFIFLIEYLLRFWITSSVSEIVIKQYEQDSVLSREFNLSTALKDVFKEKINYVFSIRAIIDLLAIIPFFHQLRLLRIFILFRVFKLFRYARSFQTFISVLSTKKFEFLTLLMFSSIVIFVSSILIYVMEANIEGSNIYSLYEAFYWSIVTISTVGYGDVTPISEAGRLVSIFVIIAGVAVLAFTTSLVVSAFTEKLDDMKEMKEIDDLNKLETFYIVCGYESIAQEVVKELSKHNSLIVLDEDPLRIKKAHQDGFSGLNYDPGSVESYKRLNIDLDHQVKGILCLRESDIENIYTALTVRSFNKDIFILSLMMHHTNRKKLIAAGVNEILYSKELVGLIAKEFVGKPVAFEVMHALRSEYTGIGIEEIFISERIMQKFKKISDLDNEKYRLVLLGIYKQSLKEFLFNPDGDTNLNDGDYLVLIGNSVFIKEFERYLR